MIKLKISNFHYEIFGDRIYSPPIEFIFNLILGLLSGYRLCCIMEYCIDEVKGESPWSYRCSQFGIDWQTDDLDYEHIEGVPCRWHMKKELRKQGLT